MQLLPQGWIPVPLEEGTCFVGPQVCVLSLSSRLSMCDIYYRYECYIIQVCMLSVQNTDMYAVRLSI